MSATATAPEQAPNCLTGFVPVQVRTLRLTKTEAADLFVQYEPNAEPVLYCRAGSHPDVQQFVELKEVGIESLYVREDDFCNLSNDVLARLDSVVEQKNIRPTEKFAALQIAVAVTVEQTLRLVDCSKFRALAKKVGEDLVTLFGDGDVLPRELFRMARHDFNTFTHVTNVASYCVILAKKLGIVDGNELQKVAAAAMLHDLGKRFIPSRILTKTTKLTPEEREIMESHPTRGYVELCEKGETDFGQLMVVYQHHEHMDGSGYPVGVMKDEIHPWARMLAVVDVFDTMTAKRPEGRLGTPEQALDFLRKQAGTQFDREAVECWISAMTKT
jgi:HD-GYP domain-containing protein (c-di-GMP phosphodiesterase class II)